MRSSLALRRFVRGSMALALGRSLMLALMLAVAGAGVAQAQVAVPESRVPVSAEAPIAGGNRAAAKERALTEALRLSVERSFAEVTAAAGLDPAVPALGAWRATWAQRPRRYVRTYRILEEAEDAGFMRVRVAADVDAVALRRDAERALAGRQDQEPSAPHPPLVPHAPQVPIGPRSALLLAPPHLQAAALEAAGLLTAAGLRADVRTHAGDGLVSRDGSDPTRVLLHLQGSARPEGLVRGTLVRAVACEVTVRVVPLPGLEGPPPRKVEDRGFAPEDPRATSECFARVTAVAVRALLPAVVPPPPATPTASGPAGAIAVTVTGPAPGPVARVLSALRTQIPGLTSVGGLRLERGRAQLSARASMSPEALAAAVGRAVGGAVIVATVAARPGHLELDARDAAAP